MTAPDTTTIPTEPIGSIPRSSTLIAACRDCAAGQLAPGSLEPLYDEAVRDTIRRFEATGSPVITDGEQRKYHNFATYPVEGLPNFASDGFKPSAKLLHSFIHLNNLALVRFTAEERLRIGIHTCPGGDRDSTHSSDVDYSELLPSLFELEVGKFFIALARETDRVRVLKIIRKYLKPHQRVFLGVIDPLNPRVESVNDVMEAVLEAAEFIPVDQLGTTDDCGFAPFSDDTSTTREVAFEKIRARVAGTALAAEVLG